MIRIDYDKCVGCMSCVGVCPFSVLEDGGRFPEWTDLSSKRCIACMHCGAACPELAIDFLHGPGIRREGIDPLPPNFPQLIETFLLQRRSYRSFSPNKVPRDTIEKALEIAAYAPSAKNQKPTKWVLMDDATMLGKMMEIIVAYVKKEGVSPEILENLARGRNVVMGTATTIILGYAKGLAINPVVDTALEINALEMILQSFGIGTCWAGYLTRMVNAIPEIREMLKLTDEDKVYGALMVGYPRGEDYLHIPNRKRPPEFIWV